MQVNKTKFKENISLQYYYMIFVEKTKDPSLSKSCHCQMNKRTARFTPMGLWIMPTKGKGPLAEVELYGTDFRWMWLKDPTLRYNFQKTFKSPTNNPTKVLCRVMQRSLSKFFLLEFPKSKYSPCFLDSSSDILGLKV